MPQRLCRVLLVLALLFATPALNPAPALAADVPATTDFKVPKPLLDWAKKNAAALYIIFDEVMDDLTGCDCPTPPAPMEPPPPY
jgi:hypothetical protein